MSDVDELTKDCPFCGLEEKPIINGDLSDEEFERALRLKQYLEDKGINFAFRGELTSYKLEVMDMQWKMMHRFTEEKYK